MDGNSVNYAENSSRGEYHNKLDSDSVSEYDPKVRKEVGKNWKSPILDSNKADYFDINKSEEKANERLKG